MVSRSLNKNKHVKEININKDRMWINAPGDDLVSVYTVFGVTPQQICLRKKESDSLNLANVKNAFSTC